MQALLRGALLLVSPPPPVAGHTRVIDYHPTHMKVASTASGSCWTGSIAANRPDAYRCMTGNEISDPCFVRDAKSVACPDIPTADSGLIIKLTKPLPDNRVSGAATPWAMSLAGHVGCRVGTGTVIDGFPYYCTGSLVCAEASAPPQSSQFFTECGTGQAGPSGAHVVSKKRYAVITIWR